MDLNKIMQFDAVVRVTASGVQPMPDVLAPTLYDEELDSSEWEIFGHIMTDAEYIGGSLADDILETPGDYVTLTSFYSCESWECTREDCPGDHVEGWAIACKPLTHVDYPHEPGRLYDCPACESECHCSGKDGETDCVYCASL